MSLNHEYLLVLIKMLNKWIYTQYIIKYNKSINLHQPKKKNCNEYIEYITQMQSTQVAKKQMNGHLHPKTVKSPHYDNQMFIPMIDTR